MTDAGEGAGDGGRGRGGGGAGRGGGRRRGGRTRRGWLGAAALALAALGGCDWVAQRELKPGQSTRDDVVALMGRPHSVREAGDGRVQMLYPRGPEGHETWLVEIGPDGRYAGMRNLLVPASFARVRQGMGQDEVLDILGPPADKASFALKQEVVWSWRHLGDQRRSEFFNVHFGLDGRVRSTSASPDPKAIGP